VGHIWPSIQTFLCDLRHTLDGMSMDRMAVSAQDTALGDLCKDSLKGVASTLDHVGEVNQLARLGTVLGSGVDMIELQRRRVGIVSADLATTVGLDAISDRTGGGGGNLHDLSFIVPSCLQN